MTKQHVSARRPFTMALPILLAAALSGTPAVAGHREPVFTLHHSGEWLREAQSILEDMNLLRRGGYAPGRIDQATERALRTFQGEHFLRVSGSLDPDTYAMLTSHGRHPHAVAGTPDSAERVTATPPAGKPVAVRPAEERPAAEEPAEEPAAGAAYERDMPATAGPIPAIALAGLVLLGAGAALLRGRRS
jgi:peptidoglycan hydrolase-like protein with peptidoglycan-binding domain